MEVQVNSTLTSSYHAGWLADRGATVLGPLVPAEPAPTTTTLKKIRLLTYRFHNHAHPWVTELLDRLINESVRGLQDADTAVPELREEVFTSTRYAPSGLLVVDDDVHANPVDDLDFSPGGAYSGYNWELFYHVPLTVAVHLTRTQRYQDAQRWLHYIFDPTDDSDEPTPERFWKVKPFREGDAHRHGGDGPRDQRGRQPPVGVGSAEMPLEHDLAPLHG